MGGPFMNTRNSMSNRDENHEDPRLLNLVTIKNIEDIANTEADKSERDVKIWTPLERHP